MYDLAQPAERPGKCPKCSGSGVYRWGACVNGKMAREGKCHSCGGTGQQSRADIARNVTYNRHKIARILSCDL